MRKKFFSAPYDSRGVALYLTIFVLSAVSAIAFGISTLFLNEFKISVETSDYIPAIAAADTGVERALYKIRKTPEWEPIPPNNCPTTADCVIPDPFSDPFIPQSNGSGYRIMVVDAGATSWCPPPPAVETMCIRAFGSMDGTNRAIEVNF